MTYFFAKIVNSFYLMDTEGILNIHKTLYIYRMHTQFTSCAQEEAAN